MPASTEPSRVRYRWSSHGRTLRFLSHVDQKEENRQRHAFSVVDASRTGGLGACWGKNFVTSNADFTRRACRHLTQLLQHLGWLYPVRERDVEEQAGVRVIKKPMKVNQDFVIALGLGTQKAPGGALPRGIRGPSLPPPSKWA
jgi:hypothetical protein